MTKVPRKNDLVCVSSSAQRELSYEEVVDYGISRIQQRIQLLMKGELKRNAASDGEYRSFMR